MGIELKSKALRREAMAREAIRGEAKEGTDKGLGSSANDAPMRKAEPAPKAAWKRNKEEKKKGKYARSNEKIGPLGLDEARKLAADLTGIDGWNLRLPTWKESSKDWQQSEWVAAHDVVIQKEVCLLCWKSFHSPAFVRHMKEEHPSEGSDIWEVMRRLSEVRASRFHSNGVVEWKTLSKLFPEIDQNQLKDFLQKSGFIVRNTEEAYQPVVEKKGTGRKRLRADGGPFEAIVDFEDKREESTIKGIKYEEANDIAVVLCEDEGALPEVLFSSSFISFRANHEKDTKSRCKYRRVYCYSCNCSIFSHLFDHHVTSSKHHSEKRGKLPEGAKDVMIRLQEIRLCRYYRANPVPIWRLNQLTDNNEEVTARLKKFLLECGFCVNKYELEPKEDVPSECESWRSRTSSLAPSLPSTSMDSDWETKSASSWSSRSSCPTSSMASSISHIGPGEVYPYAILNGLPWIRQMERAIDDILQAMNENEAYEIDQPTYIFVVGWAMYSLIVSNGCKMNVLCHLTHEDWEAATKIEEKEGLSLMPFSTKSTCSSEHVRTHVVVNKEVKSAMTLYLMIKERRANEMGVFAANTSPTSRFFMSYFLKGYKGNDVDYAMGQFLKMTGFLQMDGKFRIGMLKAAVEEFGMFRETGNTSAQYAINFYMELRDKEKAQLSTMGPIEAMPIINSLVVIVGTKVRKDKGTLKGPRGIDHRGYAKLMKKMGRDVNRDTQGKRVKKHLIEHDLHKLREQLADESDSDEDDTDSDEDSESTRSSSISSRHSSVGMMRGRGRVRLRDLPMEVQPMTGECTPPMGRSPSRAYARTPSPQPTPERWRELQQSEHIYGEVVHDDINNL